MRSGFAAIDRMGSALKSAVRGMTTDNGLSSPLTMYPYGIRNASFSSDARNGYMMTVAAWTCVTCYAFHTPQIRLVVKKGLAPGGEAWPEHPLQKLLDQPNDDMDAGTFALYNAVYKPIGGSTLCYLYRNSRKQVIGWRPYSTAEMAPVPVTQQQITRESWIDHYAHTNLLSGGAPERVERENIVTLRFPSINPIQPQLSVSPLAAAFLDIQADQELTKFPLELMKNSALMSLVFSMPPESKDWPDAVFDKIKASVEEAYTGPNKFKPSVLRGGVTAASYLPDFRRLEFSKLGERPEVRVCTALRVPIMYAGFSAGLNTSTYDNIKLSRIGFVKDSVIPQAMMDARTLTGAFRRESWQGHPLGSGTSEFTIEVDTSGVQALKDELFDEYQAVTTLYQSGGIKLNEYRTRIGLDPVDGPEGEMFYWQLVATKPSAAPMPEPQQNGGQAT